MAQISREDNLNKDVVLSHGALVFAEFLWVFYIRYVTWPWEWWLLPEKPYIKGDIKHEPFLPCFQERDGHENEAVIFCFVFLRWGLNAVDITSLYLLLVCCRCCGCRCWSVRNNFSHTVAYLKPLERTRFVYRSHQKRGRYDLVSGQPFAAHQQNKLVNSTPEKVNLLVQRA